MVLMQSFHGRQLLRGVLSTAREAPSIPRPRLVRGTWPRTSSLHLGFIVRMGWPKTFRYTVWIFLSVCRARNWFCPGQPVRLRYLYSKSLEERPRVLLSQSVPENMF